MGTPASRMMDSRAVLHAHGADHGGSRSDKFDAGDVAHFGEARVFTQESVAGVDCVGSW
jgi:hypothetical protein